ncbi:MAG: acyloxyacyl hydrolase [Acidobacteriaceae bacterium]
MKKQMVVFAVFLLGLVPVSLSQTSSTSVATDVGQTAATATVSNGDFVTQAMKRDPWEGGVFLDGGFGTSGETSDHFLNAGVRIGKVLTNPAGPGILRGQFEYAIELIPYWQAFTPKETYPLGPQLPSVTTGGTYTGLSMTPIILRWNLVRWKRVMPWLQGGGGLIWTNHKFPPNGSRGTSVWNFEPQFGVGIHYFVKPNRAITFGANAVHISNASLGDANPGVNATVQLQIGYSWWK